MSARMHGTPRGSTILFATLILATVATWGMGSLGVTGPLAERLERAVGIAPAVKVDIIIARPLPNDIYLLCSDGLSKMVSDAGMRDILLAEKDLNKAAAQLIATANAKGGRDNITVILIQVKSPAGMML